MVSKRDLNSAELATMRTSRSPTMVMTANGEVQTREEATENVKELDLFVTVMVLDETPAVLSLEETLWGSWVYIPLDQRSETTSHQKKKENWLQYFKLCAIRSPWFINEFLYNAHSYFSIIFITGFRICCQQIHRKSSTRKKWKYEWGATGKPSAWTNRNRKHKSNEGREEVQTDLLHDLPDRPQDFRENLVHVSSPFRNTVKPWAWISRHFQFFSWITNEAASKSGTGFV